MNSIVTEIVVLRNEVAELKGEIRELNSLLKNLPISIGLQTSESHSNYQKANLTIQSYGRRSYSNLERLGLEDFVIQLFNNKTTYTDIAKLIKSKTGHSVSRSSIHRFLKKYRSQTKIVHFGGAMDGKKKSADEVWNSNQTQALRD